MSRKSTFRRDVVEHIFQSLLAFITLTLILSAPAPSAIAVGEPVLAPLVVKDLKAKLVQPGIKASVLNLWATWCAPCIKEMPELVKFRKSHSAQGMQLILLSADGKDDIKDAAAFLSKQGVDFPVYILGQEPDDFMKSLVPGWPAVVPTTLVFDQNGNRVAYFAGEIKFKELEAKLAPLLKGH